MRNNIFITGAASGIGRATAILFASRGWRIGLADMNEAGLCETLERLAWPERHGRFRFDVRDYHSWVTALADFTEESQSQLTVLFNNAGIGHRRYLHETPVETIEEILDVNLKGMFWGARAAFPHLRVTSNATLINSCSVASIFAPAQMGPYGATKFGARALTESLAREWREFDIRVRSVIPAFVDTQMLSNINVNTGRTTRETVVEKGLEVSSPEKVAAAVWSAYTGKKTHVHVGQTANIMRIAARWAPWLMR